MSTIYNATGPDAFAAELRAQELIQQGAIHAVGFLLRHGGGEQVATDMMLSLREHAKLIREEAARRGIPALFPTDQTGFS